MWQTRSLPLALTLDIAASRGDLVFMDWANEHGATATTRTMDNAARNGELEAVQWVHANRVEGCITEAMDSAAGNGHISVHK
ncbi:hypothetical protein PHMEG_0001920 [Phytophthora megakarya]|uniref:Uncharacterized protein n=1 Tax=Phytophthora megakarya TaxID=4795 RepID=A0A225WZX6_9STRA|nr:hypothetical protein PHMEG_0001920 [Phytophthora megakarya]